MYVAEVGVWKGEHAWWLRGAFPGAELYLFDTFRGHDAPCEFDDAEHHPEGRYKDTSVEAVLKLVPSAHIVPGRIQDTAQEVKHILWRFVRIDMDHYLPTKFACEFFGARMETGGIIEFDDYRYKECPGATKAIDEVFGAENIREGRGEFPTNSFHWVAP